MQTTPKAGITVPMASTGLPMAAQMMPPTTPDPICTNPISAEAVPAICGNGSIAAVIM